MKIREHDCIVLTKDLADEGLQSGDVGTVIHIHPNHASYEVEFAALTGETIVVATVAADRLRPINSHDISHARELASR